MAHASPPNSQEQYEGIVAVGLGDTDRLGQLISNTPELEVGYSAPIYLVEQRIETARAAVVSLGIGSNSRFRGSFGLNAGRELIGHLASRIDEINIPTRIVPCGQHDPELRAWLEKELGRLREEQRRRATGWRDEVEARANERSSRYWSERFCAIRAGEPARILIVTTLYSTYMRHANRDLAAAFERLGHDVRILIEPDTHTMLAPHITLRAQHEFDPDIVITTNYPRAIYDKSYPPGAVNVCWVQDAMAHLFDPMPGEVTQLDFITGFLYQHAPALDAYPADRRLPFPMPVSEQKFHPAPVEPSLREQYSCDVAYISHQSRTPDELHEELLALWPIQHHALIKRVRRYVNEIADGWADSFQYAHQERFEQEFEGAIGEQTPPQALAMLWHQYAHPMLERILRHRMLGWAAEIADEHGLDFRLYGRGWDTHPMLARFACGEIPHGEALRASYQCAKVQLHASSLGVGHQRQYECAMSGGLMLSMRYWLEFLRENWLSVLEYIYHDAEPDATLIRERVPCFSFRNHPHLRTLLDERDRHPIPPLGWDHLRFDDVFAKIPDDPKDPEWEEQRASMSDRPLRLLSDPFELTFSSKDELQERVLRASTDDDWRCSCSTATRALVLERVSMGRFASTLMGFLSDRLTSEHAKELEGALA